MPLPITYDIKPKKSGEKLIGHQNTQENTFQTKTWDCQLLSGNSIKKIFPGLAPTKRPPKKFCTGSIYEGDGDSLGFSGNGIYTYPHGVIYEGQFSNGQFHGRGTLTYPNQQKIDGVWYKGILKQQSFTLSDNIKCGSGYWNYLQMPDRTYATEAVRGLRPPNQEFITSHYPPLKLPPYTYDMADQTYYDNQSKTICGETGRIEAIADAKQENFIPQSYRQEADNAVGYHPEYYENWCSGRKMEILKIKEMYTDFERPVSNNSLRTENSNSVYYIGMGKI